MDGAANRRPHCGREDVLSIRGFGDRAAVARRDADEVDGWGVVVAVRHRCPGGPRMDGQQVTLLTNRRDRTAMTSNCDKR
jgi:hypothetical protein